MRQDIARDLTDEAIERVEQHADDEWKAIALRAVRWIAERHIEFTTDEVWAALRSYYPDAATREPRAMGAIMRQAAGAEIIRATDRVRISARPECHSNPKRVWASMVYGGA